MIPSLLLLPVALAGSLGSAPAPADLEAAYAPRRVALLVGVDTYGDPDLAPLRFSGKDARDLATALGGDAGFDHVHVLDAPESATRSRIEAAIQQATSGLQRDDTFLLYLSGHGTLTLDPKEGTRLWFLPSDGVLSEARETGLAVDWLEEAVGSVNARRRVLVLDTCHNGRDKSSLASETSKLLAGLKGDPPPPRSLRDVSESEARLYAAQYYQPAMEDPNLENGVYTHFLIDALTDSALTADLDRDGLVDVTEAHDWARDATIEHTGGMQVPRAEFRIVGREKIYLAGNDSTRSRAERALLTAADAILAKGAVLVDGQPRGVLPDVIDVAPGTHVIEIRDAQNQTLVRRRVRLKAGETYRVEDLLVGSDVGLAAGAVLRHGPGAGVMHPTSLEVQAHKGLQVGPSWVSPAIRVRATYGSGTVEEQGPLTEVQSGAVALGLIAPLGAPGRRFRVGPQLEWVVPWRFFEDTDGAHRQATTTLAPGVAAQLALPLSNRRDLVLRYEFRGVPYPYADVWTSSLEHGLTLGTHLR